MPMNQITKDWQPRRISTNIHTLSQSLSSQTQRKQDSESEMLYQRARKFFNQLRPQLINQYFNWYIAINPDTGEYLVEQEYLKLFERLRQQKEKGKMVIFRLNETGVCGRI